MTSEVRSSAAFAMVRRVDGHYGVLVAECFGLVERRAHYDYDFGDGWEHSIELEQIRPQAKGEQLSVCTGGRRACPREDCGGPWGYSENFLPAITQPDHPEHKSMREWYGRAFNPEYFKANEVVFSDPRERWRLSFDV